MIFPTFKCSCVKLFYQMRQKRGEVCKWLQTDCETDSDCDQKCLEGGYECNWIENIMTGIEERKCSPEDGDPF